MNHMDILQAAREGNKKKLVELQLELVKESNILDVWFNKYLDLFSEKMTDSEKTDPMWKLYNSKFKVYQEIKETLKKVEYYLNHV